MKKYRALRKVMTQDDSLLALTKAIHRNQLSNNPVHEWSVMEEVPALHETAYKVQHIMSTQLFTVNENDLATLATNVMHWKNIHHLPVENNEGNLTGLLTWTHMKDFRQLPDKDQTATVEDIMTKGVISVPPETRIDSAIRLMKENVIGCLPIVQNHQLVGIITINDLLKFDNAKST
ncbi:MAG: CBS domain-containing protein [Bacteroidota bacterium]